MEKYLLGPLPGPSATRVEVHHAFRFFHLPHMSVIVLYYGWFQRCRADHRNDTMLVECSFLIMFTFCLCKLSYMSYSILCVIPLQFEFLPGTLQHYFSVQSNSPTTVYCLSTSNKSGDVLYMYSLLPTFLVFIVSVVTVASVTVVKGSDSSLSLPKYTVIFL